MQGGGGGGVGVGGGGGGGGGMAGGGGGGDACTVFVGNLAWGTTDDDLLATFQVTVDAIVMVGVLKLHGLVSDLRRSTPPCDSLTCVYL